jgi:IclR family transcriptional regulator, acetate operon repressor
MRARTTHPQLAAVQREAPSDLIQSLQRGLRVLELVAAAPEPLTPKEIAGALGVSLGTAYHLINTLAFEGYVVRGPRRVLLPGPRWGADPAPPAAEQLPVPALRALGRAAYAVDDVAVLTTLREGEAVVLAVEEVVGATSGGRYAPGARHLPHLTAAGRAMLAMLEGDRAAGALERLGMLARAQAELLDRARLDDELASARELGYAVEIADGEACVGAPVVAPDGSALGAVAAVVAPRRVRHQRDHLALTVRRTAAAIGRALSESTQPTPGGTP